MVSATRNASYANRSVRVEDNWLVSSGKLALNQLESIHRLQTSGKGEYAYIECIYAYAYESRVWFFIKDNLKL